MEKPPYSELPKPMERHEVPEAPEIKRSREVIVIGGGLAGLSAAIYLGRALRDVLVIDAGESLAIWEPEVQNYLGFPDCIEGRELLRRGKEQALKYGAEFVHEEVDRLWMEGDRFQVKGKKTQFEAQRLLLATGVYHLPPKIPCVNDCVGKSMFFCKDCDGYRVRDKRVIIAGHNNDAVEYALGIMVYTESVRLLTNGEAPGWDATHEAWLQEYKVPMHLEKIVQVEHQAGHMNTLTLATGEKIAADCLFTTRGDVFHNQLAQQLGAKLDEDGQVIVDRKQHTSVRGLYAAGCVTPANCQMIIAAGDGAVAAQAINRDIFEESLRNGALQAYRKTQAERGKTERVFLRKQ
ncbi:MAG: NAD(P)/FAD-dependent oxidoreductase [Limisphaerales bacterium]